jgi:hypothetical protein
MRYLCRRFSFSICLVFVFQALQKAFHCYKPVDRQLKLVPLLATLSTYEIFYKVAEDGSQDDDSEALTSDPKVVRF